MNAIRKQIEKILHLPRKRRETCYACGFSHLTPDPTMMFIDKRGKRGKYYWRMKICRVYPSKEQQNQLLLLPHVIKVERVNPTIKGSARAKFYAGTAIFFDCKPSEIKLGA